MKNRFSVLFGTFVLFAAILFALSAEGVHAAPGYSVRAADCGVASDEATLDAAIACANGSGADTHTIALSANISITASTRPFTNTAATSIDIIGNGFVVDGQLSNGVIVFIIEQDVTVTMDDIGITGGNGVFLGSGGGILNIGNLSLTDSHVYGNVAFINGGGILNGGTLTMLNSAVTSNTTNFDPLQSLLRTCICRGDGAGIANIQGTVILTNTTVSDNIVLDSGFGGGGGGIYNFLGNLTLLNSTVSGNAANVGGGIANSSLFGEGESFVSITNSTISGNTAYSSELPGEGGGIYSDGGEVTLTHVTISNNSASSGGGIFTPVIEQGQGFAQLALSNTIVAEQASGEDCSINGISLTSGGHNLDGDGTCNFAGNGDISSGNANLEPLALNAPGNTQTHALTLPSDAYNGVSDPQSCSIADDQRGVSRPQGPLCDIGAFELESSTVNIVKIAAPSDGTNFAFSGDLGAFTLDDTGNSPNDNDGITETFVFTTAVPGIYTVNETALPNWVLDSVICTSTDQTDTSVVTATGVQIDLDRGEEITCTFTNLENGTLVIQKNADIESNQIFEFTSPTVGDFTLIDDGSGVGDVISLTVPGNSSHSISETVPAGWLLDRSGLNCDNESNYDDIFVSAGGTVLCTFNNVALPGSITIIKDASPANGQDFDFTFSNNGSPLTFTLDDAATDDGDSVQSSATFGQLIPGVAYTVVELLPADWGLNSVTCTGGSTSIADGVSILLDPGEQITCTFNNSQSGQIEISKATIPSGGTGFTFSDTIVAPNSFVLADGATQVFTDVAPGSYTITEADLSGSGFDLTDLACDDASATIDLSARSVTLNVEAGDVVRCTFTNTQRGSIIIEKQTDPDGATESFAFSGAVTGSISDGQQLTASNVVPGTYTATEDSSTVGFFLSTIECNDGTSATPSSGDVGTRTATMNVDPGETVTCTFTNSEAGAITVQKLASSATANLGETITYTYRITNSGGVLLSNVVAVDNRLGSVSLASTTLAPGAATSGALSHVVVESNLPGPLTNTVVTTGTPPVGPVVTASDAASVNLIGGPVLTIEVSAVPILVTQPGGEVSYPVSITNSGPVDLTLTELDDVLSLPQSAPESASESAQTSSAPQMDTCVLPQPLAVGETYRCMYTRMVLGNAGQIALFQVIGRGLDRFGNEATDDDAVPVNIINAPTALEDSGEPAERRAIFLPLIR